MVVISARPETTAKVWVNNHARIVFWTAWTTEQAYFVNCFLLLAGLVYHLVW
jgi:hypothetical protein